MALVGSAPALAGTYVINDCPASPGGSGDAGVWSAFGGEQGNKASCGGGEGDWIGPHGANMAENTIAGVQAVAPGSTTMRQAKVWLYVPRSLAGATSFVIASINGGILAEYQTPLEQRGTPLVFNLPSATTSLTIVDYCANNGNGSGCSFGAEDAADLALYGAQLTLQENVPPGGSATGGALTSSATLSGSEALNYSASDADSGVRLVQLRVDGAVVAQNDYTASCPYTTFAACPPSESGTVAWNTASVPDGKHTVELLAQDAAQNTSVIYSSTISTQNAPASSSAPVIHAPLNPVVGEALPVNPGVWSAPSGAGAVSLGYQWEACDAQGENCKPIGGASAATYTPTQSELGDSLRVQVSASDNDGQSVATSASTAVVASPLPAMKPPEAPQGPSVVQLGPSVTQLGSVPTGGGNGPPTSQPAQLQLNLPRMLTRPFARRALQLTGHLRSSAGTPIAGASLEVLQRLPGSSSARLLRRVITQPDGSFSTSVPPGPTRVIEVGYRTSSTAGYAAESSVQEIVGAGVTLSVTPQSTGSTGAIVLTGRVEGAIPRQGVIVDLLVHYRGQWVPFRTPRTNASGEFNATYQFQGSVGRFPFRAEVPLGQAGFFFDRGLSRVVEVATG